MRPARDGRVQPEPAAAPHPARPRRYRAHRAAVEERSRSFRPTYLVVAFGTDAHEADPIGGFKLPTGYFHEMGAGVRELGLPTLVTQEGLQPGNDRLECRGVLTGLRIDREAT